MTLSIVAKLRIFRHIGIAIVAVAALSFSLEYYFGEVSNRL
jgi:hypothetical protein